jgi:hypothetical protein
MTANQRLLIGFYALIAIAALFATWSQNLQLFSPGSGPIGPFAVFVEATRVNPASRSITVDIGFFLLAASAFMVIEARRLGVRFVWLYIVFAFLIAISVTFPLFMIARELRLGRAAKPDTPWSLSASDVIGLALVTLAVLALSWRVLS